MTIDNATSDTPTESSDKTLATVKFRSAGKQYDFDTAGLILTKDDEVVVETNKGRALGSVVREPRLVTKDALPPELKQVLRLATKADLNMARISASKEDEAHEYCLKRISHRKMAMKLVKAEYLFDGSKIIFYFTADGRVDFRELVKDLAQYFHTRIEMRQIGVRDEAKLIGGIGICGRELCCGTFLTDFHPVSVRMAKQQGLALNPTKISGQCGRLLCCLGYEYGTYCKMAKQLPKHGSKTTFEGKPAEVVATQTLAQTVTLRCEGKINTNVPLNQLNKSTPAADTQSSSSAHKPAAKTTSNEQGKSEKNNERNTNKQYKKSTTKPQRPNRNKKAGEQRNQRQNRHKKTDDQIKNEQTGNNSASNRQQQRPARNEQQQDGVANKNQRQQQHPKQAKQGRPTAEKNQNRSNNNQESARKPESGRKSPNNTPNNTQNNMQKNDATNTEQQNNSEQNNTNKPSKRRNRNRRRPPRKP